MAKERRFYLLSTFEPINFDEASNDEYRVKAMNEELDQIEKNDTWHWCLDQGTKMS